MHLNFSPTCDIHCRIVAVSAGPSVSAQNAKRIEWVCLRDLVVTMCTAGASTMCCLFKFRALRESWSHGHRDRIQFRLFNSISIFNITLRCQKLESGGQRHENRTRSHE